MASYDSAGTCCARCRLPIILTSMHPAQPTSAGMTMTMNMPFLGDEDAMIHTSVLPGSTAGIAKRRQSVPQKIVRQKQLLPPQKPLPSVPVNPSTVVRGKGARDELDPEILQRMVSQFNTWWYNMYQGLQVDFRFGQEDWRYMTPSEVALARNDILSEKLKSLGLTNRCTILDVFCGCAADLITFISDVHPTPAIIMACDENKQKVEQAKGNVRRFQQAWLKQHPKQPMTDVQILPLPVDRFIWEVFEAKAVDLLYLDPPWTLVEGEGEVGGGKLVEWLDDHVFRPMRKFVAPVNHAKLIIIKTRFSAKEMKTLKVPGYIFVDTLDFTPFRQEVHFHTLQNANCTTEHVWHPSRMYRSIYPVAHKYNKDKKAEVNYVVEYVEKEDKTPSWIKVEYSKNKKKQEAEQADDARSGMTTQPARSTKADNTAAPTLKDAGARHDEAPRTLTVGPKEQAEGLQRQEKKEKNSKVQPSSVRNTYDVLDPDEEI